MPRVRSQKIRQALLDVGETPLDPFELPEKLQLYDANGQPLHPNTVVQASTMLWRGVYMDGAPYFANEVVVYDDGDGLGTYIFNEPTGDEVITLLFDEVPVGDYVNPDSFPVDMVLDQTTSPRSFLVLNGITDPVGNLYSAHALKVAESGTLALSTAPETGVARDMGAKLWRQDDDIWTEVDSGDDEAGLAHPEVSVAATPGIYLFTFTIFGQYRDGAELSRCGTSILTLDTGNTAVLGSWGGFPIDKVTRLA